MYKLDKASWRQVIASTPIIDPSACKRFFISFELHNQNGLYEFNGYKAMYRAARYYIPNIEDNKKFKIQLQVVRQSTDRNIDEIVIAFFTSYGNISYAIMEPEEAKIKNHSILIGVELLNYDLHITCGQVDWFGLPITLKHITLNLRQVFYDIMTDNKNN